MASPRPEPRAGRPRETPRSIWSAGDFARVASGVTLVSELLCEAVELHAGERVVDVGTATGNTALAAARRRTRVVGVDIVPELLDAARERAMAERLEVDLREGDAERLPFADGSFDVALSTFGVTFVARPERAAAELLRITRPGGRIGLTAWDDRGFTGRCLELAGRRLAPGSGAADPLRWSRPPELDRWFEGGTNAVRMTPRAVRLRAESAESLVGGLERFLGPLVVARAGLDPGARAALHAELLALASANNSAVDGTVLLESGYAETVIQRRA